jgi:hypothetical protein
MTAKQYLYTALAAMIFIAAFSIAPDCGNLINC